MRRSKLGPIVSATGGNKRAAQVSGINTNLVKTLCFIFVSVCSAIAGLFVMSATLAADQAVGLGWQLWVIAIAIIGGASFSGGVGTILGSFLGTILMMIIRTGLAAAEIKTNAQGVVVGAILVAAAVLDVVRSRMKRY
jgi:ribose/xylose/arabinose/galactoside ABC-type transport system permease subunit